MSASSSHRPGERVIEATGKAFRLRMAAGSAFAPSSEIVCERPYFDRDAVARALTPRTDLAH